MSKDEAVQLLNSVLNKNAYAAIRDGRRLRVMSKLCELLNWNVAYFATAVAIRAHSSICTRARSL